MYEQIFEKVKTSKNIVIFPHTSVDGDSVACAKALYVALTRMGKDVIILCDEPVPDHVSFLAGPEFLVYSNIISELLELRYRSKYNNFTDEFSYDLAIAVDCSDYSRIENRLDIWNKARATACIDHHPGETSISDNTVRDPSACAAAMLVYEFLKESGIVIDKEIAEAIYAGIVTDTGGFRFSNTDARTHEMVAELFSYGIDVADVSSKIYDSKPLSQLKIEAYALRNVEILCDGKLAISCIPYSLWNPIKVPYSYTESSIDVIRSIKGVEVAVVLKEKEPEVFKVSMRSKSYPNVSDVAVKLGGGGHKKAAACTLEMPLETAKELIVEEIEAIL